MIRPRPPRVSERALQQQIVTALRTVGATVYVLGTTRPRGDHPGTCQTAGLPDLCVHLPQAPRTLPGCGCAECSPAHQLWIECKAAGGRLRPAQQAFRDFCLEAGVPHLVGDLDVVLGYLHRRGYLREVAHYRRQA